MIEAIESLKLNFTNIRQGLAPDGATRPIEVLQPIQALAQARVDYLDAVLAYNRSQFRLYRALGNCPVLGNTAPLPPSAGAAAPRLSSPSVGRRESR